MKKWKDLRRQVLSPEAKSRVDRRVAAALRAPSVELGFELTPEENLLLMRELVADFLDSQAGGGLGLASGRASCPHCGCRWLMIHQPAGPWATLQHNLYCAYECVRCGATHLLGDWHGGVEHIMEGRGRNR